MNVEARPAPAPARPGSFIRGALRFGGVEVPTVRGRDLFDGDRQRAGLLDHHDVIFTVLTKMQFGKVKAFYAGGLKLRSHTRSMLATQ